MRNVLGKVVFLYKIKSTNFIYKTSLQQRSVWNVVVPFSKKKFDIVLLFRSRNLSILYTFSIICFIYLNIEVILVKFLYRFSCLYWIHILPCCIVYAGYYSWCSYFRISHTYPMIASYQATVII